MQQIILELKMAVESLQENLPFTLTVIGALYGIHILNWLLGYRLNVFGIYPRRLFSIPGIGFSPFLHAHFNHLFFNSIPLFVLMSFVLLKGMTIFLVVSAIITVLTGIGIWLFGRPGFHVGASGVIMGYWSYLLIDAYQHITAVSIALAVVCLYYFGGLLFHLFPEDAKASWEAHVFGFLAGIAASYGLTYLQWVS